MLQFITRPGVGQHSPAEQIGLAMEGGCRWVEIDIPGATDDEVRRVAREVIGKCEDTNTILIIRDHIDVVEELRVSGIRLSSVEEGVEARQRLGAHAIIGVNATDADTVKKLKKADLDYAYLPVAEPDRLASIVAELKVAEVAEPVVAGKGVTIDNVDTILATGVNGVAVGQAIAEAADPEFYTRILLDKIRSTKA